MRNRTKWLALVVALLTLVPVLPLSAALPPGGTFTDDDGNTHEGNIEAIAATGVTKGCNPPFGDKYCPSSDVDRGAMAAFLKRALNLPAASKDYFSDDDGSTFEADINAIAEAGITKGCNPPANTLYCPNSTVRRGEMAAFLKRALNLPAASKDYFSDDDGSTFEADINAIAEAGITKGCNPPANTLFCPNSTVRRGEMAAFLKRALNLPAASKDYFSDDDGSTFEADINAIAEAGITKGCNPPANDMYCASDPVRRDAMASFLARAFGYPADVPPVRPALDWDLVVSGLSSPVQAIAPPGEDRLMIVQQGGLVRVFENGSLNSTPFLDITGDVLFSGERGLLSIAFHPDYPADRRMFVWYVGTDGNTYLDEYDIAADLQSAGSPRTVLEIDQPASNHNGGFVAFGDDGYLYLSTGDGGGGNNSYNTARNLNSLLGKILRIDVDGAQPYGIPADNPYVGSAGRDEIWASGLRNPWRWSFGGGYMFIGDVGQGSREEIDVVPVAPAGYDFGWSRFEGSVCNPNDSDPSCSTTGLTFPVAEYTHSAGQTVIGGILYKGTMVRSLSDYYLYADIYSGIVRGFRVNSGRAVEARDFTSAIGMRGIVSFGEDGDGELLAVSLFDNAVYRLTGG